MKTLARFVIAGLFFFTGALHFLRPDPFLRIVPTALPCPLGLVYLSGFFELAGAVGLLIPRFQRAAAYGLVVLLIAVLPANVTMAIAPIKFGGFLDHPLYRWVRIPFQGVLITWVLWCTKPKWIKD